MLSIVIPCLNEPVQLNETIASLDASCENCPFPVEVIVVDDGSSVPVLITHQSKHLTGGVLRHDARLGVSPSRHIGIQKAAYDWLFMTDCHMRFTPDWWKPLVHMDKDFDPANLYCGRCAKLTTLQTVFGKATTVYWGAKFELVNITAKPSVLRAVWAEPYKGERLPDELDIQCVMGACYLFHRSHYEKLRPLEHLRGWGYEEQMLSIKTHLSGGRVVLLPNMLVGHVWREKGERRDWDVSLVYTYYNCLLSIHTLMPPTMAHTHALKVDSSSLAQTAREWIRREWTTVRMERARNERIFERDFHWLIETFGLA